MPSSAFVTGDFKVFDAKGFQPRMAEIRGRVRPKLEALGKSLAPALSRSLGGEVFAHVARHARRSEEHTSELQSHSDLVCRLLLEKKKRPTMDVDDSGSSA